jgi:putative membrane protein
MDRSSRIRTLSAGLLAVGVVAACGAGEAREEDTGSLGSAYAGESSAAGASATRVDAGPGLNDANIVALLDHAHQADSAAASVAAAKGTDERVRRYARTMMSDHHRLRLQGSALAKKLNVIPQPRPDDPVTTLAHEEMAALESTKKGRGFDRVYIEHEITAHQAVLDLTEQSIAAAGNAELRSLIEQARPLIQAHLRRAQEIREELGGAG